MINQEVFPPAIATSILNELPDPVVWVKPILKTNNTVEDFEVGYCNRAANEAVRHPLGKLTGLRILRDGLPSRQSAEGNFQHFLEVYLSGETTEHVVEAHHSGRIIENVRSLCEGGVLNVSRDRRGQREAGRKEAEKTQLIQGLIDHAPLGIAVYESVRDADGLIADFRIKLYNQKLHDLTGVPEELRSRATLRELLGHIRAVHNYERLLLTVETGEPQSYELHSHVANGWLHLSIVRLGDGFLTIITDITEQKKTLQQLERTIDDLHRTNQNLERFTFAASHDLKEPVRKISVFTNLLKSKLDGKLADETAHLFKRLKASADRMMTQVDDLMLYSEVRLTHKHFTNVDLNKLLKNTLKALALEIEAKGASIHTQSLPCVRGHAGQLQQMLLQLICNALKYTQTGVPPEITISCRSVEGKNIDLSIPQLDKTRSYYLLEVTDNGIGFEEKDAERIFNVFTSLHGYNDYPGTGIGLSIVRKVVENHGGVVSAKSTPNKGATFSVYLPFNIDEVIKAD